MDKAELLTPQGYCVSLSSWFREVGRSSLVATTRARYSVVAYVNCSSLFWQNLISMLDYALCINVSYKEQLVGYIFCRVKVASVTFLTFNAVYEDIKIVGIFHFLGQLLPQLISNVQ